MAILRVTKFGEKVLHRKTKPVKELTGEIRNLIKDMYETMYVNNGVGLAGPQVGQPLALAVVNVTPENKENQFAIINPKIVEREGKAEAEEGCLSLPGVGGAKVKRADRVTVEALNEQGLPITIKAEGLLARCLQHEIDHLNGTMIINRAPLKRKFEMRMAIRQLKKEGLW